MRPPMTTGGGRGAVDGFEAGPMTAAPWGWLPRHRGALASRRAVTGPFRAPGFELAHRYSVTGCGTDFLPWKWAEMDRAAGEVAA